MTLLDRSTERIPTVPDGTVPRMGSWPTNVLRRLYAEITPDDSTLTTRVVVRLRAVAFVLFLCAVSAVAGSQLADRTAPGACLAIERGRCAFELTPHRDGTITVRLDATGMDRHEDRMPAECIRPGSKDPALGCPDWVVNWYGQR